MLTESELNELRHRWRDLACSLIAALPLQGVDERTVVVSGSPLGLFLGSWADISLCEGPGHPCIRIRAQAPGNGLLTAGLDADDGAVIADVLDCVGCLSRRRQRHLDQEQQVVEAELADMVTMTGWVINGVGGRQPTAAFRSADDRVRGRLNRSDRTDGDPSRATFSVIVEIGGVGYARALDVLAGLQRGMAGPDSAIRATPALSNNGRLQV